MVKETTIKTERLLLRAAKPEDAPALHEAFKDEETMKYGELPYDSITLTEQWLEQMSRNGKTDFSICLKQSPDVAIGTMGIGRPRPSNEIGFVLDRRYWREGITTEALRAVLDYLFSLRSEDEIEPDAEREEDKDRVLLSADEMDSEWLYPSITARVDPRNVASIRVLAKLHFERGDLVEKNYKRSEEETNDTLYLRLERKNWMEVRKL